MVLYQKETSRSYYRKRFLTLWESGLEGTGSRPSESKSGVLSFALASLLPSCPWPTDSPCKFNKRIFVCCSLDLPILEPTKTTKSIRPNVITENPKARGQAGLVSGIALAYNCRNRCTKMWNHTLSSGVIAFWAPKNSSSRPLIFSWVTQTQLLNRFTSMLCYRLTLVFSCLLRSHSPYVPSQKGMSLLPRPASLPHTDPGCGEG
jgi:hypothetical protein